MNIEVLKRVYFIGIGGIGMSALAKYFLELGIEVAGYDKTPSTITKGLEKQGANITFDSALSAVPQNFLKCDLEDILIIYTPAIPNDHPQLQYFNSGNFEFLKRAQVLGEISKNTHTLAVAGTHGKTTTSTLLAHLLYDAGIKVTGFLGGISENYHSNYISSGTDVVVVEADEFDRSFLQLSPNSAAITNVDADHLDIYKTPDQLQQAFIDFSSKESLKKVFIAEGVHINGIRNAQTLGVLEGANCDYQAVNIKVTEGRYTFDLQTPKGLFLDLKLAMPGLHNLRNAVTALAMAMEYGVPIDQLKKGLLSFKGIQRRFSYQVNTKELVYIDDYAHHPTEIKALHQAISQMHPNQKITAIFQPHLFSRTKDFAEDFAKSLDLFDEVLLLDIYPARELPIEGVDSDWLFDLMKSKNNKRISLENIEKEIKKRHKEKEIEILTTIGAGDIGTYVTSLKEIILS